MKSFFAWMYIKNNKLRCAVLSLMMACVAACFIAGMYVDNPLDTFEIVFDKPSDYCILSPGSGSTELLEEFRGFAQHIDEYTPECAGTVFAVNETQVGIKSIMGFENIMPGIIFLTPEDFAEFNRVTHSVPDDMTLSDGEIILSRTLANNWGASVGDVLEYRQNEWEHAYFYYQPFTVKAILDMPGTVMYAVGEQSPRSDVMVLRSEPSSVPGYESEVVQNALSDMIDRVRADYPHTTAFENSRFMGEVRESLSMMTVILTAITVMVGVVLAITVNATFTAAYDKRRYEFSIYKALGFTGRQIFGKIASEVLILNGFGLVSGLAICTAVILLANYILYPSGVGFVKISVDGLIATLGCDLMVLIPVMLLNWRRVRRYDVTEW